MAHFVPYRNFYKVDAMSDSRTFEDLPISICSSFGWNPVFFYGNYIFG